MRPAGRSAAVKLGLRATTDGRRDHGDDGPPRLSGCPPPTVRATA